MASNLKHDLSSEAERIISIVKRDLVLPDGSLGLEKNREVIRPYHIFYDLGDFLPFLLYFGEEKFADKQISLLKNKLSYGVLLSQFKTLGLGGLAKTYEYTDLLLGLTDYYLFKKDEESKKLLIDTADKAISIFNLSGKHSSFYHVITSFRLPVVDTRDGTLIECFMDLAAAVDDKKYVKIAENIHRRLFDNNFYKKYSLLPTFFSYKWFPISLLGSKFHTFNEARICKNNTNTLFALLSLYRYSKDPKVKEEIFRITDSIYSLANKNGGIYEIYKPTGEKSKISLTPSFSVLDFLCDSYKTFSREKDILFAREIADFWISKQGKTGLIPIYINSKDTFIDSDTDMFVALTKLYELTGDKNYIESADKILNGLIKFHGKFDYALSVNIDSGELINPAQRTKFLTLFLKAIILKEKMSLGETIYGNEELFSILRDR